MLVNFLEQSPQRAMKLIICFLILITSNLVLSTDNISRSSATQNRIAPSDATSPDSTPLSANPSTGILPKIAAQIGPQGGIVTLVNYALLIIPKGAFSAATKVTISAVSMPDDKVSFEQSTAIFGTGTKLHYNIFVNTGVLISTKEITLDLLIPKAFSSIVPSDSSIVAFAQLWQDGGVEILDNFEGVDSTIDSVKGKIRINLHPAFFTDERGPGTGFEAIVTLATVPNSTEENENQAPLVEKKC